MGRLLDLTARAEREHFWFRGFRAFMEPEVAAAVAGTVSPLIVDCGCGTGANVAWLQRYGRACGFDLTWNGLVAGREMGRRHLARASIGNIPMPSRVVDLATSFDVFQCLPDGVEQAAVVEIHRILKPGGHLLMNVAALDVLRGQHSTLSEEVRRYTKRGLRQLIEGAGFSIVRLTYVYASLFPLMLPVRVAQRWMSGGNGVPAGEFDITVPAVPVNRALTWVLQAESAVLRVADLPIGSSLMVHAIKPRAASA